MSLEGSSQLVWSCMQGSPASVLEYVEGSSLRSGLQRLAAAGPVSGRLRTAIALQAARGVSTLLVCVFMHTCAMCSATAFQIPSLPVASAENMRLSVLLMMYCKEGRSIF